MKKSMEVEHLLRDVTIVCEIHSKQQRQKTSDTTTNGASFASSSVDDDGTQFEISDAAIQKALFSFCSDLFLLLNLNQTPDSKPIESDSRAEWPTFTKYCRLQAAPIPNMFRIFSGALDAKAQESADIVAIHTILQWALRHFLFDVQISSITLSNNVQKCLTIAVRPRQSKASPSPISLGTLPLDNNAHHFFLFGLSNMLEISAECVCTYLTYTRCKSLHQSYMV